MNAKHWSQIQYSINLRSKRNLRLRDSIQGFIAEDRKYNKRNKTLVLPTQKVKGYRVLFKIIT